MSILHLSDPHFGTEQPQVVEALVRLAAAQQPRLLVLSGDITQRARRSQFRSARRFVDRLGIADVLAIPGNHDIPLFNLAARLFAPYGNHCGEFGTDLEPAFESGRLLVLTLNTTRRYRHKHGEVSPEQVERVAARLARASADQLRIVVTHQPVAVTLDDDLRNLLRGREHAMRRWAEAGADLILGGHIHLPFAVPLHEREPALTRPLWAVQAGTAVSSRVRRGVPNSVNLLRYEGAAGSTGASRACLLERWDYAAAHGDFRQAASLDLPLAQ